MGRSISSVKAFSSRQCVCAYAGVSKDKASGQDSYLFFSVEQNELNPSVE